MVHTLLAGPMVYTLCPCFSKENCIHHSLFGSVTSGLGGGVPRWWWWCILFPPLPLFSAFCGRVVCKLCVSERSQQDVL